MAKIANSKKGSSLNSDNTQLIFGKQNYTWMLIGFVLVMLGLLLMVGGSMPSSDVWDPSTIYSFRRTVLSPIVILLGFGVEVYAIFKR